MPTPEKTSHASYIVLAVMVIAVLGIQMGFILEIRSEVRAVRTAVEEIHDKHFMQPVPVRTPYPNNDPADPICGDPAALPKHDPQH